MLIPGRVDRAETYRQESSIAKFGVDIASFCVIRFRSYPKGETFLQSSGQLSPSLFPDVVPISFGLCNLSSFPIAKASSCGYTNSCVFSCVVAFRRCIIRSIRVHYSCTLLHLLLIIFGVFLKLRVILMAVPASAARASVSHQFWCLRILRGLVIGGDVASCALRASRAAQARHFVACLFFSYNFFRLL